MLKIFKHPLYKREIIQVKWPTLLMSIAILLPILISVNEIDYAVSANVWRMYTLNFITAPFDLGGWLVLPIFIISQFFYTRKDSVSTLIQSLPYSRNTQLKYKYIAGLTGLFLAYFASFLFLVSTYFSAAAPFEGSASTLVIWFVIVMSSAIFQYSFLFLVGSLMGNSIYAGVVGFFTFYAPSFIVLSIAFNFDMFFDYYVSDVLPILKWLMPQYIVYTAEWFNKSDLVFMDYGPIIGLFTLGSVLLYKLSVKLFELNDFEHNGNLCMFLWVENVFLTGFTLCFGLLVLDFSHIFQSGWLYPVAIICGFACFPFGYILAKKLMLTTGHQLKFKRT